MSTTQKSGGAIAGYPFDIEMTVIICMNMIKRKYILASFFVNYSNKFRGRKVYQRYLEVRTVLLRTFLCAFRARRDSGLRSI